MVNVEIVNVCPENHTSVKHVVQWISTNQTHSQNPQKEPEEHQGPAAQGGPLSLEEASALS